MAAVWSISVPSMSQMTAVGRSEVTRGCWCELNGEDAGCQCPHVGKDACCIGFGFELFNAVATGRNEIARHIHAVGCLIVEWGVADHHALGSLGAQSIKCVLCKLGLRLTVIGICGANHGVEMLAQAQVLENRSGVIANFVGEDRGLLFLSFELYEEGFDAREHDRVFEHDGFEVLFEVGERLGHQGLAE